MSGQATGRWPDAETWPWAPRWVELGEGRLHYVREGEGPRVVLVHGTPTWSYEWRHVIRALSPGHEVVAVDHLGFGRSDRPMSADYSPEGHAARFRQAMATLAPTGSVALVVHDFGGPIALDWALDHVERLSALVVVNTWLWPLVDDPAMARTARMAGGGLFRFLYRRFNASLRLIMPSAYADRRRLTRAIHAQYLAPFADADARDRVLFTLAKSLAGSTEFYASLWQRRERLAGVPAAVFWGMKDPALKASLLERWREAVPHADVRRFDDAGHWPQEEVPDQFATALREVLSASSAPPRSRQDSAVAQQQARVVASDGTRDE
jgi:haloalkane dehalogenase